MKLAGPRLRFKRKTVRVEGPKGYSETPHTYGRNTGLSHAQKKLEKRLQKEVLSIDRNRVHMVYNTGYDICKEITDVSQPLSKAAADEACEEAFIALDRLRLNSCHGWRHAGCRSIPGHRHRQCACTISNCGYWNVRTDVVKTFRDCAQTIKFQEQRTGKTAAPTNNFQRRWRDYDDMLQEVRVRRAFTTYSGYYADTGSSRNIDISGHVAGPSSKSGPRRAGRPTAHANLTTAHANLTTAHANLTAAYASYAPGAWSEGPAGYKRAKPNTPHTCDQCGQGNFRSARVLFDHKRAHHTVSDLHCYICNLTYQYKDSFATHLRYKHPEIEREDRELRRLPADPAEADELMPFACSLCQRRYSSEHGLRDHLKSHTTDETKCPVCKKKLSTKSGFKTHMQNLHPGVPVPEPVRPSGWGPGGAPFVCARCGKGYTHKSGLRDHEVSHRTSDTHCILCDRTLSTRTTYKSHMKRKHPAMSAVEIELEKAKYEKENPEECQQCGKRFKNLRGLRNHLPVHEGKTQCKICGAILGRRGSLTIHMKLKHSK